MKRDNWHNSIILFYTIGIIAWGIVKVQDCFRKEIIVILVDKRAPESYDY